MYRKLIRAKSFIKDYEKRKLTDQHYSKFIVLVGKLIQNKPLPSEAKDHIHKYLNNKYIKSSNI